MNQLRDGGSLQVCEKLEGGLWISGRDEEGPYIKRGDQWIGYDDPISVKIKSAFVRAMGLGGISLWSLDLDDFQVFSNINLISVLDRSRKIFHFGTATEKIYRDWKIYEDTISVLLFYLAFLSSNSNFASFISAVLQRIIFNMHTSVAI